MKLLKGMSLSFVFCLLMLQVGVAQTNAPNLSEEEKAELQKNMKEFVETLELTETQQPEFEAISMKYREQMVALRDQDTSKWSKYRKMKSINKSRNKEMKKLLSKEQYKRYVDKQKEIQKEMKARNRG